MRTQFASRIRAATGVSTVYDRIRINGREQELKVIGSDDQYPMVRNLVRLSGRFMSEDEVAHREHVAMITEKLAQRLYGSQSAAVGETIKIQNLQFTIIGTFKEKTDSFGLSELVAETVLIPITVIRFFLVRERIDPMYVQARTADDVVPLTREVQVLLRELSSSSGIEVSGGESERYPWRGEADQFHPASDCVDHDPRRIALGDFRHWDLWNIMLVTVTERTREIGLRMSLGAPRRAILQQFLLEATLISVGGGLIGIAIGIGIPLAVNYFGEGIEIPVAFESVIAAFLVSAAVGLIFGMLPASRASRLNPTEALRYE